MLRGQAGPIKGPVALRTNINVTFLCVQITLDSLTRAAQAVECQLVYALIPRRPLQQLVEERARSRARRILEATSHSMALKDQRADKDAEAAQLEHLVRELTEKSATKLWEDE